MDIHNSKKRDGQQIQCKDMLIQETKKLKRRNLDYTKLFLEAISLLPSEKKNIVRKLGFASILDFSCTSNVNDIYIWLLKHLKTKSSTLIFKNGFSFTLTPAFVFKLLGIPHGSKPVVMEASMEDCKVIYETVQMECPSVEHLCNLLKTELDEVAFSRIFMMVVLDVLISPNGTGYATQHYYHNLINVPDIPNLDWCTYALQWLLIQCEMHQTSNIEEYKGEFGGCKLILVLAYFEFLITSEYNLGNRVPRLPLWSTYIVDSYIVLDSLHGSKKEFGRLARKHISSTIFKGLSQPDLFQIPQDIQDYINNKFQHSGNSEVKRRVESLTHDFLIKMIKNSVPTIKSYVDDVLTLCSEKQPRRLEAPVDSDTAAECAEGNELQLVLSKQDVLQMFDLKIPILHFHRDKRIRETISLEESKDYLQKLYSIGKFNDSDQQFLRHDSINELIKSFSNTSIVSDTGSPIPFGNLGYMIPQLTEMPYDPLESSRSFSFKDFMEEEIKDAILHSRMSDHKDMKFCLRKMDFCIPGEEYKGDDHDFFLFSNKRASNMFHFASPSTTDTQFHHSPNPFTKQDSSGWSLNDRLLGYKTPSKEGIISFELFEEDDDLALQADDYNNPKNFQTAASLLPVGLDNSGKGIMSSDHINENRMQQASHPVKQDFHEKQVVFATEFEQNFYKTLITSKSDISPRIFQVGNVWVDQRTLTLSMNPGGWIHPFVMDCFGMLTNEVQLYKMKHGPRNWNDIIKHIVIKEVTKMLMDPHLNHNDPLFSQVFRLRYVGFRLENAGLVHIPCPLDKQWILIVANFYDKTFDILNPDKSNEKFQSIVHTVVSNFKAMFAKNYPGTLLKINEFTIRNIEVPKHNFRYDSGVFIMQFIRWYDGIKAPSISNADVEPIRQQITSQLVTSSFNEHQIPLVQRFLAIHAPHLLH